LDNFAHIPRTPINVAPAALQRSPAGNVADGSKASFDASGSDFRYYPESRHLLALQYLTKRATFGLMHRNIIGEAQTERPPRAAVSPKSYQMFLSGGCECSGVLALPAPSKQTQRPDAGGEQWESGR
jgi:hypothetical protein